MGPQPISIAGSQNSISILVGTQGDSVYPLCEAKSQEAPDMNSEPMLESPKTFTPVPKESVKKPANKNGPDSKKPQEKKPTGKKIAQKTKSAVVLPRVKYDKTGSPVGFDCAEKMKLVRNAYCNGWNIAARQVKKENLGEIAGRVRRRQTALAYKLVKIHEILSAK